jgi:hypothetical protein
MEGGLGYNDEEKPVNSDGFLPALSLSFSLSCGAI